MALIALLSSWSALVAYIYASRPDGNTQPITIAHEQNLMDLFLGLSTTERADLMDKFTALRGEGAAEGDKIGTHNTDTQEVRSMYHKDLAPTIAASPGIETKSDPIDAALLISPPSKYARARLSRMKTRLSSASSLAESESEGKPAIASWSPEVDPNERPDPTQIGAAPPVGDGNKMPPSNSQLWLYFAHTGIPSIGFGFVDNFIMIVAGDQLESRLGAVLGLSTLAAAGFGNMVSDMMGVSLQSLIETSTEAMGVPPHGIPIDELEDNPCWWVGKVAAVVGIAMGCYLGMCPLMCHDPETTYMKVLFDKVDKDGDGKLDLNEITTLYHMMHVPAACADVEKKMQKYDFNGSGHIDFKEFCEMFKEFTDEQIEKTKVATADEADASK